MNLYSNYIIYKKTAWWKLWSLALYGLASPLIRQMATPVGKISPVGAAICNILRDETCWTTYVRCRHMQWIHETCRTVRLYCAWQLMLSTCLHYSGTAFRRWVLLPWSSGRQSCFRSGLPDVPDEMLSSSLNKGRTLSDRGLCMPCAPTFSGDPVQDICWRVHQLTDVKWRVRCTYALEFRQFLYIFVWFFEKYRYELFRCRNLQQRMRLSSTELNLNHIRTNHNETVNYVSVSNISSNDVWRGYDTVIV